LKRRKLELLVEKNDRFFISQQFSSIVKVVATLGGVGKKLKCTSWYYA
jgi:hypothetical protein